ncbi:MAG: hypothetical protein J6S14_13585 [Clostridia bacterium]|nr:hypothetical protein [Clostridia bacterium]
MTLADIEKMTCEVLTAEQIAPILQADPHGIRLQAHDNPERLGFRVIVMGSRVKIPRLAFLQFMKGEEVTT